MRESAIQNKIIKYLDRLPDTWTVKTVATNKPGTPDILCCYKGRFVAFEVKASQGGKVSKLQKYQIKQIYKAGGTAIVCSSLEEVIDCLSQLDDEAH